MTDNDQAGNNERSAEQADQKTERGGNKGGAKVADATDGDVTNPEDVSPTQQTR